MSPEKKSIHKKRPSPKKATKTKSSPRIRRTVPSTVETPKPRPTIKPAHRNYRFAVGRRKSAVARVRFFEKGSGTFQINGRGHDTYFPTYELKKIVRDPLSLTQVGINSDFSVKVSGGGKRGQAEAVRLGISRVLVKFQPDLRTTLKRAGFLTRDPRVKERKKYGLKRARRAPQWQKR